MSPEPSQPSDPRQHLVRDHERRDANAKWIFAVIICLFISAMAMHGILAGFLSALKHKPFPQDQWRPIQGIARAAPKPAPFPVLQVSPPLDLSAFREREQRELESYGWINRTSGIVRVPIELAMDLVLKEGLPVRTNVHSNVVGPSSYQLIQQRPNHREPEIQGEK